MVARDFKSLEEAPSIIVCLSARRAGDPCPSVRSPIGEKKTPEGLPTAQAAEQLFVQRGREPRR